MKPRLITVAVHVPEHVTDQEVANSLWRVLRVAMHPHEPGTAYPDHRTLEVNVLTIGEDEDRELRHQLFGAGL